ncbi:putative iron-regulated membrane protein [Pseudomonas duriflava]|uniref:Putative iron-regulated membrane protein n=1 Tax=Pseudomonas duriflava TaxID=459528 RepID=A0A562QP67_9PSED|nr:PepSY domain-containing protein [Pseudomonas duriflava]TWI58549.1 putative iron-regulated membrane protein [Pseudomonas duriflava]
MTSGSKNDFYSLAWRWHFYAGLFVAPFMILLTLTGIIYLFKPQLDPLLNSQLEVVQSAATRVSIDTLRMNVQQRYPQGAISQYISPLADDRSAQFMVSWEGRDHTVFVDPYRGDVLGEQDAKLNLQAIARALHGELMVGTVGDRLIELAAGWGIVLVVSGLYLWWPRSPKLAGAFWPRWRIHGRPLWRDLHGVAGFWSALALLFLLISGMTWTGFWGKQYADLWNRFPAAMWNAVPKSDQQAGSLNHSHHQTVPWAMENTPMPVSGGAHSDHAGMGSMSSMPAAPLIGLQQVVEIAEARKVEPGYSITVPTTADGVFTISVFADDPRRDATLHIDQYTGKVLADVRWQDYSPVAKATELGVMLHEGRFLGLINQLIVLLACLLVLLLSVSGLVMWWKRKPVGRLGVPPLRHELPRWKTAVAIMSAIGLIFPLVGLSMIMLWALDRLVLIRWPLAQRILS